MASLTTTMLSTTEEDSESDGGVVLVDLVDLTRRRPQIVADYLVTFGLSNMACLTTTIALSTTEDDSDSDGGVPLVDPKYRTRQQPQILTEYLFTFGFARPSKMAPIATVMCVTSTKYASHLHSTSDVPTSKSASPCCNATLSPLSYYKAPDEIDSESEVLSESITDSSMANINELLDQATIHQIDHVQPSTREIRRILRSWARRDEFFAYDCRAREATNPYPHINMNIGQNRARYGLEYHFRQQQGGVEERLKIEEGFARFSFSRQADPRVLTEDICVGIERMFVGAGREKSVWAREPGSWWAVRKKVFAPGRGVIYEVKKEVKQIKQAVALWLVEVADMGREASDLKRSFTELVEDDAEETAAEVEEDTLPSKKFKMRCVKSEEVMGEDWRARRRLQEKKAGRWTDGTLRMDRLWETFHWVQ